MISKQQIREVVEPKIKELKGFLVDIKVNTSNNIIIFFDRMEGVKVEHCLEISKYFELNFDREIEDYELTVCSAGIDRPFVVDEQYQKYIGSEVGVLLNNGKKKTGIILSYEDRLKLKVAKKKERK